MERLVATGDVPALQMKPTEFQDTCDMLSETSVPELKAQLRDRYLRARNRLAEVLDTPAERIG